MRGVLAVSILAVSLAGCVTPPKSFDVKASREYAADKEQIWQNLMRFFATNSIQIKTLEKESGVVFAERSFQTPSDPTSGKIENWADCGVDTSSLAIGQSATMNVFVEALAPDRARATVTTDFGETRQGIWASNIIANVRCNSTGELEKFILDRIGPPAS